MTSSTSTYSGGPRHPVFRQQLIARLSEDLARENKNNTVVAYRGRVRQCEEVPDLSPADRSAR